MNFLRHLALAILLSIFTNPATAQPAEVESTFTYNFSAYSLKPIDRTNLFYRDALGQFTELTLNKKQRSELYEVKLLHAEPVLRFFRKLSSENGSDTMNLVAETRVQSQLARSLLVFSIVPFAKSKSLPYSPEFGIVEMDDSKASFPKGSIRLLNATGVDLFGDINGVRFELKQGKSSQPLLDLSSAKAQVSIAARGRERYHLLYKNFIPISGSRRSLLIIRPPGRIGSLKVSGRLLIDD